MNETAKMKKEVKLAQWAEWLEAGAKAGLP